MTERLTADPDGITRAANLLRAGKLVAFGTETVYGLGGDATNPQAVAAIFTAKGRPRFNPLICHYPSADQALQHVVATEQARKVAQQFWPGPLTIVLARASDCPVALLASAGLDTLAVRVPRHPVVQALLRQSDRPIAAPSANPSGGVSPTSVTHVLDGLGGRIAAVLDSGPCSVGLESTVLDLSGPHPVLLRPGGVTLDSLEACLGTIQTDLPPAHAEHGLRSPGLLASHYAPNLTVRLNATSVTPNEGLLAFGRPLENAGRTFQLSSTGDTAEAASRLFQGLRHLDADPDINGIAVMPIPDNGLGRAINDRLQRAAAPRVV